MAISAIPKVANHDDLVTAQRCGMKIRRWEHISRINVDLHIACAIKNKDVGVNAEIAIVGILMLSGDLHPPSIWKLSRRHSEAIIAPDSGGAAIPIEELLAPGPTTGISANSL